MIPLARMLVVLVLQPATDPAPDLKALRHPARQVREAAIHRLAGDESIDTGALTALFSHEDSRVARAAMRAAALRNDADALPALARAIDGDADVARAEEAARAAVAIAMSTDAALDELGVTQGARLQRAVDAAATRLLAPIKGYGHTEKTQRYRPLLAGGTYSGVALRRLAADPAAAEGAREHALLALALLEGRAAEAVFLRMLDSAAPRVRVAACSLLFQYGSKAGHRTLARRLDTVRLHRERELAWVVAAVERSGALTDVGAAKLARLLREGPPNRALGAAAALRRTRPKMFAAGLRARVLDLLSREAARTGAGSEVALYEFRVGPLPEDLKASMRATQNPLLRAAATVDRKEALALIAGSIAPEHRAGPRELMRVRIVHHLLLLLDAPDQDRVRFAARPLRSQVATTRRYALRVIQGVDDAPLAPLLPRLRELLDDEYESVRLGAAEQLAPDPKAIEVAIRALYDGRRGGARRGGRLLGEERVDPDHFVRRRRARERMRQHKSATRGKE